MCQAEFAEGTDFTSALREVTALTAVPNEDESADAAAPTTPGTDDADTGVTAADDDVGFERLDICEACWVEMDRGTLFSWWANRREITPPKPPAADPELLWLMLAHTAAHHAPERAERDPLAVHLGYLAALGLLRLKHLKLARHFRVGETPFLAFVGRESREREWVVLDPEPSDKELETIERTLDAVAERIREGEDVNAAMQAVAELPADALTIGPGRKKKKRSKRRSRRGA